MSSRQTWKPSISGIIRSSRITSTGFSRASCRHSAPEMASIATKPSRCRWRARIETVSGSSSTTMICGSLAGCSTIPDHCLTIRRSVRAGRRNHAAAPQLGGKGGALEPQQAGRRLLVAAGLLERLVDHAALEFAHDRVEIDAVLAERRRESCILGSPRGWRSGRAAAVGVSITSSSHMITSRSIMFSSSRTLPGQSYDHRLTIASRETVQSRPGNARRACARENIRPAAGCPSGARAAAESRSAPPAGDRRGPRGRCSS